MAEIGTPLRMPMGTAIGTMPKPMTADQESPRPTLRLIEHARMQDVEARQADRHGRCRQEADGAPHAR